MLTLMSFSCFSEDVLFTQDSNEKFKFRYKITDEDISILVASSNYKNETYSLNDNQIQIPRYNLRHLTRSGLLDNGQKWEVFLKEITPNKFTINGVNSNGEQISQICGSLYECFLLV